MCKLVLVVSATSRSRDISSQVIISVLGTMKLKTTRGLAVQPHEVHAVK